MKSRLQDADALFSRVVDAIARGDWEEFFSIETALRGMRMQSDVRYRVLHDLVHRYGIATWGTP